ncbi:MAG: LamB/YcsF family protein [Firmicutes bacterium]|nr:LamB/YcsF family protein [Bacillota bacterium]
MTRKIDLNCDLGESFGAFRIGNDEEVIRYISSANVACGFHAGDPRVMEKTVMLAKKYGVAVGAHVGYPDLAGFGRREMRLSYEEARTDIIYQLGALFAFCRAAQVPLCHVKPHGAMYNMANREESLSRAIVDAILAVDGELLLFAQAGSLLAATARKAGLRVVSEAFADRAYREDGTLADRSAPGSVIEDPQKVLQRVLRMVLHGKVETINGQEISVEAQTICVHGDNPNSLALVVALREGLQVAGIVVSPP